MVNTKNRAEHPDEEEIDETLEETFPASDPPSWTLGLEPPAAPPAEDNERQTDGGSAEDQSDNQE